MCHHPPGGSGCASCTGLGNECGHVPPAPCQGHSCPGQAHPGAVHGWVGQWDFAPAWGQSPSCPATACPRSCCSSGGLWGVTAWLWGGKGGAGVPWPCWQLWGGCCGSWWCPGTITACGAGWALAWGRVPCPTARSEDTRPSLPFPSLCVSRGGCRRRCPEGGRGGRKRAATSLSSPAASPGTTWGCLAPGDAVTPPLSLSPPGLGWAGQVGWCWWPRGGQGKE